MTAKKCKKRRVCERIDSTRGPKQVTDHNDKETKNLRHMESFSTAF